MSEINREAIFSDTTEYYIHPSEPMAYDYVRIRCRVAKNNVDSAVLMTKDHSITMHKVESDKMFDYYQCEFSLGKENISYYFKIQNGSETAFYNRQGTVENRVPYFDFRLIPGFQTPDWAKGAVFYQIYVDRFCDGDHSNNVVDREYVYIGEPVKQVQSWSKYPAQMGVREFYGGDLKGVLDKLDYLKELGVEVLYLNPVFVSPSNHKYDTQDYDYIDPHYTVIKEDGGDALEPGDLENSHATKYKKRVVDQANLKASNEYFAQFVREVHNRGMKVILDGVFNHCGSFNKWMDREQIYEDGAGYEKGAYVAQDSPYNTFFKFRDTDDWPYNNKYDGWWGHDTLPKLNYEESEKLFSYIMRIAKKWVSPPYSVDGWRLDVAADLGHSQEYNHKFWREFRRCVKEANPNAMIIAEHYGDVTPWLSGGEWDTVMNYDAFMEPLTWFLTGMEKHSDVYRPDLVGNSRAFWGAMERFSARFTTQSLHVAMNELSNHDHSRFLTRTNRTVGRVTFTSPEAAEYNVDKSVMMAAVVFQMTWPGAPTVYYGDEAGVCGWSDPDNRRTFPWGNEDMEMINCHKELIRIHKDYAALRRGSVIPLYSQDNFISFGRFDEKDSIVTAIHIGNHDLDVKIPVWKMGCGKDECMVRLAITDASGFSVRTKICYCEDGYLTLHMTPKTSFILKNLYPIQK